MGRWAGCGVGIQWCTLVLSQNVNLVTLRGHTIKIIVMTWNKTCMQNLELWDLSQDCYLMSWLKG